MDRIEINTGKLHDAVNILAENKIIATYKDLWLFFSLGDMDAMDKATGMSLACEFADYQGVTING